MDTQQHETVLSEDGTPDHTKASGAQAWVNRHVEAELLGIESNIAWIDGRTLDQLICKKTEDGWLAILKAHKGKDQKAAFVAGATYTGTLELVANFAAVGCLTWQYDKWPPKVTRHAKP